VGAVPSAVKKAAVRVIANTIPSGNANADGDGDGDGDGDASTTSTSTSFQVHQPPKP